MISTLKSLNIKDEKVALLCLGNIYINDTNIFKLIKPKLNAVNIIYTTVFNIPAKYHYDQYVKDHLLKHKTVVSNQLKSKVLNDLTLAYKNALLQLKSVNNIYNIINKIIEFVGKDEKGILIIVYDDHISNMEKFVLRKLLADKNALENLPIKTLIMHHRLENQLFVVKHDKEVYTISINHVLTHHVKEPETKQAFSNVLSEIKYKPLQVSKVTKILTNIETLPKQNRKELYDKITDMLVDICNTIGLKVLDISYEIINNISDIEGNILRRYKIKVQLPYKEEDTIIVDIPEIVNNAYFYVNGTRRVLQYQMLNNPIVVVKPETVKLHTLYSSVTLSRTGKKNKSYKLYAAGLIMNPILVFLSQNRLDEFAKLYGLDIKITHD